MDQFYLLDYFTTQMIIPLTVGFFINPKTAVRRHSFHDDYDYDKANDTLISFVFLSDGYYGKVPQVTKRWLCDLETIYIVYHVLVISTALKLVGPSVTKLTLPLLACNLLFVAMLLVQSIVANRIGNNVGITLGRDNDDNNNNRYQHFFYRNVLKVDYLKSMEWSIRVHENDGWYDLVKDKKLNLGIVTLFIIVNIILFSLQDIVIPPTVYWATHSLWHVFGPITAYILYAGVF